MVKISVKESLRAGWNGFKARPWVFIQAGLVLLAVNVAVSIIQEVVEKQGEVSPDLTFGIANLLVALLALVVSFLMSMGETNFFLRAHDSVKTASIRDLWHPQPFWKYSIAMLLLGFAIFIGLLLLIVPGVILAILTLFVGFIIIEKKVGPVTAFKESVALTKGNRWPLFWLSLAMIGVNILGFLALVVGLLVTVPVTYLAITHVYRMLSGDKTDSTDTESEVVPA